MDSNQKQTFRVRGRHYFSTIAIIEYEKVNPKTQKVIRVENGKCERDESQIFTKQMIDKQTKQTKPKQTKQPKPKQTKGEKFQKSAECKNSQSS